MEKTIERIYLGGSRIRRADKNKRVQRRERKINSEWGIFIWTLV